MAFGIPGSESTGGGEYLSRIQYDSRVGFWQIVKRVQNAQGAWINDAGEQFKNPTMLFDFGSLEVGYLKFASPPGFMLAPYGQPVPPRPEEMMQNQEGQSRKAFLPGFRIKVASSKVFGDADAYYWAHNAKTVLEPMDELHQTFLASPEAATGQVPLVAVTGTRIVEVAKQRYHAPVFQIMGWYDRIPAFGERTVPPPAPRASAPISQMTPQAAAAMANASMQTGTNAANTPKAPVDEMPF
jgi:hypothetical protein